MINVEPPTASARHAASGGVRIAVSGVLVLQADKHAFQSLVKAQDGTWLLETNTGARPVLDREIVVVDGEAWSLDLPCPSGSTMGESESASQPMKIALQFRVSRDEEYVEVGVVHANGKVSLPPRSYHYLLLTLARARLADASAGVQEKDQGWLGREELCRMLATEELRLNVDVCRMRKQLAATGIHGAASLLERLPKAGRMRLGTGLITIERASR